MAFDIFVNFNGNCREAVEFYAKVFKLDVPQFMYYKDAPPDENYPIPDSDKNFVMYACLPIYGCNVMFSDCPTEMPAVIGTNISLTISSKDKDELTRIFNEIGEGGEVGMPLQVTFWSDWYGMATDKFGVIWQVSHDSGKY